MGTSFTKVGIDIVKGIRKQQEREIFSPRPGWIFSNKETPTMIIFI